MLVPKKDYKLYMMKQKMVLKQLEVEWLSGQNNLSLYICQLKLFL